MTDPYRHPAGRTCAGSATLLTVFAALLAALVRRCGR
jgi:hypothetical protein